MFSQKKKRVVGIIQARMGSKRFPGKSMVDLAGKPLLAQVLERVKRARRLDVLVLATTPLSQDEVLAGLAREYGVEVFRGAENDLVSRFYEAAKRFEAEVVVRMCADNPVMEPAEIDRIIEYHLKGESDFSSNMSEIQGNGYPDGLGAEVFDFETLEGLNRLTTDPRNREHPHTYFYEHPEKYRIGTVQCPAEFRRPDLKLDVNTPEEYRFMKALFENLYPLKHDFHITDIIQWYDRAYHISEVNEKSAR
jgi:spore coat polysaccharide biosynthesis protein SpsF